MQKLLQLAREHVLPAPHLFEPAKQFMQNPTHIDSLCRWMSRHTPIAPSRKNVHLVMMGIVLHTSPESVVDTHDPNHESYDVLLQATAQLVETLCLCECDGHSKGIVHSRLEQFQTAFKRWNAHDTYRATRMLAMAWVDIESASRVVDIPNQQPLFQQLRQHAQSAGVSTQTLMAHVANQRARVISRTAAQEVALMVEVVAERLHSPAHAHADAPRVTTSAQRTTVEQSLESVVKRAFWDAFVARLEAKHTDQLTLMLDELKHKLKELTPSRSDLHTSIDAAVDTSLVVQMVRHGCLDAPEFLRITDFVVEHIHRTQAPADRTRTEHWHTRWHEAFQSGAHSFGRLCALFLEDAHTDIDNIAKALEALRHETTNKKQKTKTLTTSNPS